MSAWARRAFTTLTPAVLALLSMAPLVQAQEDSASTPSSGNLKRAFGGFDRALITDLDTATLGAFSAAPDLDRVKVKLVILPI